MPELPEVEFYRALAEKAKYREIQRVFAPDAWYIKGGARPSDVSSAVRGKTITDVRRHGKLLVLDLDNGILTLGLHFGMSGRLIVDDVVGVDDMAYSSNRMNTEWNRFGLIFNDGGSMYIQDPRRLGGVELEPNETRLGPDAITISFDELRTSLKTSHAPVKARIMDQARISGIGNLLADEILWRAGIDPTRVSRALTTAQVRKLHTGIVETIPDLIARGGSHLGDLIAHRTDGGRCPRDGALLIHTTVGGRSTWYCPKHQH